MKMKNLLLSGLSLVLVAALAVGGTLAFLTDRDSEVNTFTVGDVAIDLTEDFKQGAELIPGVEIEKVPAITNTGDNDAWVWLTFSVPAALDTWAPSTETGSHLNVIHWNPLGATCKGNVTDARVQNAISKGFLEAGTTKEYIEQNQLTWDVFNTMVDGANCYRETIEGVAYNTYVLPYNKALEPGETTLPGIYKVYLDAQVDIDPNGDWYRVDNGVATAIDWNSNEDGAPMLYVSAYAIQAEGFADVYAAYAAYSKQWGENGGEYADPDAVPVGFQVNDSEELADAVANGETVIWLNPGTYKAPAAAQGKTLTLNGTKDAILAVQPTPGASEGGGQLDYSFDGSKVTFNGITIQTNSQLHAGYARLSGTYNNCVIQNTYNLGTGDSAFYDCQINITNEYLRVNGAYTAVFDGCTFNTDGRAILVFQDGTSVAQTVTVKDCTFNATAPAYTWNGIHVAAVSIDTSANTTNGTFEVKLEGTNTVDSNFKGLWQIKAEKDNNLTVSVDGSVVH